MTKEKKENTKRQTKAGMMKENGSETGETATEKKTENTPKISKEKAENRNDDRPIH
jgi:hypothetical protein